MQRKSHYSAMKRTKNDATCGNWMDLEIVVLNEIEKSDRESQISDDIAYM